jgi:uncharacterized membrane protein
MTLVALIGLFLAGLLAGIELAVRYGIHPALVAMSDRTHLEARHEIVRIVRVIVPAILIPSVLVNIAVLVVSGSGAGLPFRWAGAAIYASYLLVVFLGTVPINDRFFDWDLDSPPADWKDVITRWARIDIVRSALAILAFAVFLIAALLG